MKYLQKCLEIWMKRSQGCHSSDRYIILTILISTDKHLWFHYLVFNKPVHSLSLFIISLLKHERAHRVLWLVKSGGNLYSSIVIVWSSWPYHAVATGKMVKTEIKLCSCINKIAELWKFRKRRHRLIFSLLMTTMLQLSKKLSVMHSTKYPCHLSFSCEV